MNEIRAHNAGFCPDPDRSFATHRAIRIPKPETALLAEVGLEIPDFGKQWLTQNAPATPTARVHRGQNEDIRARNRGLKHRNELRMVFLDHLEAPPSLPDLESIVASDHQHHQVRVVKLQVLYEALPLQLQVDLSVGPDGADRAPQKPGLIAIKPQTVELCVSAPCDQREPSRTALALRSRR